MRLSAKRPSSELLGAGLLGQVSVNAPVWKGGGLMVCGHQEYRGFDTLLAVAVLVLLLRLVLVYWGQSMGSS